MTSGQALVDAAFTFLGEPYSTAPGRTDPTSGHKDCSGLIVAAHTVATGEVLGANVSSALYRLCRDEGMIVPYEDGIHIAGALGFKPDDPEQGIGANGHVVFFTGDGATTIEATPPRVAHLPIGYNAPFSPEVGLLPGIDYSNGGHGTPAPQEDRMKPGLFLDAPTGRVYVYDPNNHTKTWLQTPEALASWQAIAALNGVSGDIQDNETTRILLADAADLRAPAVTVPGDCPPGIDTATGAELYAALGPHVV